MIPLRATLAPGALAAGLGILLALALARVQGVAWSLPLDDAWIHAAFARHLAQGHWGLFVGGGAGGETSPLWPWLLAVGELFGAGLAPRLALLLGAGSLLLLGPAAGRLATTASRGRHLAVVVGLCGPLLFLSLSGMEAVPALLCGLLALGDFAAGRSRRAVGWAGLSALLRPDGLLLLVVLVVGETDHARSEGVGLPAAMGRALRRVAPGFLLAVLGLLGLALAEGHFPPATLGGRRWLASLSTEVALDSPLTGIPWLLLQWGRAAVADLGGGRFLVRHEVAHAGGWLLLWKGLAGLLLAGGLGIVLRWSRGERSRAAARLLLVWTLWMLLFYGLVLPTRGHAGRYQPQVLLVVLLLTVEALGALCGRRDRLRPFGVSVAMLLGLAFALGTVEAVRAWPAAVAHIEGVHRRAAAELPRWVDPGQRVAVFDVGALAYDYEGAVQDISGLTDREIARALREGTLGRILPERGVTHLLLPLISDDGPRSMRDRLGLAAEDGVSLEELTSWESDPERWGPGFHYSGNALRRLVLYRWVP